MARETKTVFIKSNRSFLIEMAQSNDATIVVVELETAGGVYSASGTSKRGSGDSFDSEVGLNLALSRALESLARKLVKDVEARAYPKAISVNDLPVGLVQLKKSKGFMESIVGAFRRLSK